MKQLKCVLSVVIAGVLLLSLFSGCGGKSGPLQIWVADRINEYGSRAAYMQQTADKNFEYDLTLFSGAASATEEMISVQTLQSQLMAGEGPDVIVFTEYEFGDVRKLGDGGNFLDLSEYWENSEKLDTDNYVEGIMQEGWFGDECYYIPLGYSVINLTTTQLIMDEMGWEPAENMAELMDQAKEFVIEPNGYRALVSPMAGPEYDSMFDLLFRASGVELIDHEKKKAIPDEEALRTFLESYCAIVDSQWKQWEHVAAMYNAPGYWGDFLEERNFAYRMFFMMYNSLDPYMQLAGEQETYLNVLGDMYGGVAGHVTGYVAINANTLQPDEAWAYVETLLGSYMQESILGRVAGGFMDLPVHKGVLADWIAEYSAGNSGNVTTDENGFSHMWSAIDVETAEQFVERAESAVAVYNSPTVVQMLWESMVPYFEGRADYDTCLEELRDTLVIYARE